MNSLPKGHLAGWALLLLVFLLDSTFGQAGEQCLAQFKRGQEDFVIDVDESVKDGATFISSPQLTRYRDCVSACCKEPECNVAVMERGSNEGVINSCFLLNCLYNKQYACRFVRKNGYSSYILDSVYDGYLERDVPTSTGDQPPTANGGHDLVVQPQDAVTLNGVESKDDQGIVTYQWQMLTAYPNAVFGKTTFDDQMMVSNLTSGVYKFQLTVTDAIGQSDSTKVTVLVLTPEQSEHQCMTPMKIGPCRGLFPRWHYNGASEQCEMFNFGGCKENKNNYLSKDECMNACASSEKGGRSGRLLPIPPTQGERCGDSPCSAEEFTCENGCCLDRGLECDSTPQCSDNSDEKHCAELRCTELPDTGSCRDSLTKWYYNPLHKDCFRFNYGGCLGNDNRFDSKKTCARVCHGVTEKDIFAIDRFAGLKISEAQSGIIAIAALLGVAIFVLLCVLLYCLCKGKKKTVQHHRVPVNTVPVSLEGRERLVYNSTTKPI
ncbi:kunitz-type protease inhibitor 1a isoform X2 [Trematomus bernacchii]|uniref:kunitz-type protease inhibitor 1a isoform X2 n=1 Tax=Trematomus bernacchii TaxID=40690 RepID=UPI00146A8261|nr:kunitz-type protease inhibitor 1a isoform X2 [Trematomus bernacchii]